MAVTLTEAAAEHVRRHTQGHPRAGLRIRVKRNGCSGFAYVVDVDEEIRDGDNVFESNGVRIVVDSDALPIVDGTRIDYARQGLNEGFVYDNPNVKTLCGCGESFGV
jgi:iron-sulfur cluster assembly protein